MVDKFCWASPERRGTSQQVPASYLFADGVFDVLILNDDVDDDFEDYDPAVDDVIMMSPLARSSDGIPTESFT